MRVDEYWKPPPEAMDYHNAPCMCCRIHIIWWQQQWISANPVTSIHQWFWHPNPVWCRETNRNSQILHPLYLCKRPTHSILFWTRIWCVGTINHQVVHVTTMELSYQIMRKSYGLSIFEISIPTIFRAYQARFTFRYYLLCITVSTASINTHDKKPTQSPHRN